MFIPILLDGSGSMSSLWQEAISSINMYVKKLKMSDVIHMVIFSGNEYKVVRDCKVKDWIDVSPDEYIPGAMTPLYDACGKIMQTAEKKNTKKTMLIIMTDGHENNSKEYTNATITAKMKDFDNRGWEVIFLGANFDNVDLVSSSLGRTSNKTINYSSGNFMRGMESLADSTLAYASGVSVNFDATLKDSLATPEAK